MDIRLCDRSRMLPLCIGLSVLVSIAGSSVQNHVVQSIIHGFESHQACFVNESTSISAHRRLSSSSELSLFRSLSGFGLRGHNNEIIKNSSPEQCASLCVVDLRCLSFDVEANTCYLAFTDRYASPNDFLPRPASTYYEWQGAAASPTFEPNGGSFLTSTSVRLFTQTRAASVYYKVVASNGTLVSDFAFLAPNTSVTLPEFPCQIVALANKTGLDQSAVATSLVYNIYASKYMYLVPFYDGKSFHGKLTRIKLDVQGKKRPRPSLVLEFTDVDTFFGIGPFVDQVQVIHLTTIDPRLSGFYDAFSVVATTNYVNVSLAASGDTSKWSLVEKTLYQPNQGDVVYNNQTLVTEEHMYLSPFMNNQGYSGLIAKVYLRAFDSLSSVSYVPAAVATLDLSTIDPDLTGFASCFTNNNYGYFVQRVNKNGLGGKIVRIDLAKFHLGAAAVTVLDLELKDPRLVGFGGGFTYGKYAYLVPLDRNKEGLELNPNYRYFPTPSSSLMARIDLTDFSTVNVLDLSILSPKYARGFFGGFTVNSFAYFVPYMWTADAVSPSVNPYHGQVVRLNLLTLAVETLDLTLVDPSLKGFMRGFAYGEYAILVPHRNGQNNVTPRRLNPSQKFHFGKIVRIDTDVFTPDAVDVLDLTTALRAQIPNMPDVDLRGFVGGGATGDYGFFVPYFNGVRFSGASPTSIHKLTKDWSVGKVVRVNLRTFNEVQVLDMTQLDDSLRGFTGGILSKLQQPTDTSLWTYTIPQGTRAKYTFITAEAP
ncbi:hypothetical protein AeMF1_015756 [Aphanomyces euteiches]|nr:hypothetical protein AeMF1_015756 [Aphanomyces euteiches]